MQEQTNRQDEIRDLVQCPQVPHYPESYGDPVAAYVNVDGYLKVAIKGDNEIITIGGKMTAVVGNEVTIVNKWGLSLTFQFDEKTAKELEKIFINSKKNRQKNGNK